MTRIAMPANFEDAQVVILAAGRGTRLGPYTERAPKALAPIGGRAFLAYLLDLLRAEGLRRFLVVAAYKAEQLVEFGKNYSLPASPVRVVVAPEDLGTGGHLRYAEDFLEERFFLIFGDTYLAIPYRDVWRQFAADAAPALMTVSSHLPDRALANVALSEDQKSVLCYRKGVPDPSLTHIDAGVACLRRECLGHLPPKGMVGHLEEHLYPVLARSRALGTYVTDLPFFDIGTPQSLERFGRFLRESRPQG